MFSPTHPLQLVLGLIIWSIWLVLIYTILSVTCSVAPPADSFSALTWVNGALFILTIVTTALLAFFASRCWRAPAKPGNRRFVARVAAGIYLAGAMAVLAVGLPVLVLPPCL